MPEYTLSYAELDDFKAPKGETVVAVDPDQNGAWRVTTEVAESKKARAVTDEVETR